MCRTADQMYVGHDEELVFLVGHRQQLEIRVFGFFTLNVEVMIRQYTLVGHFIA